VSTGTVILAGGTISGTTGVLTGTSYDVRSGTISAILGGTGAALTKTTSSTATLSGDNTYTGLTTVSSTGILVLSGNNTAASGGVTLNTGATLHINSATAIGTGTLTVNGGTIGNGAVGAITLTTNNVQVWNGDFTCSIGQNLDLGTGTVTLGNNIQILVTSNSRIFTIGGVIRDGGNGYGITRLGTGSTPLVLAGNNTYSGLTTVSSTGVLTISGNNTAASGGVTLNTGATLRINSATALGTGTLTINGGTIDNNSGSDVSVSTNNAQIWNGDFIFPGNNGLTFSSGTITLGGNIQITSTGNSRTFKIGGSIGDGGNHFSLTKAGTRSLELSGNNTYTGLTIASAGILTLSGENTAASGGVTLNTGATLNINSATALGTGIFTINGGTIVNTATGAVTLTTNNAQVWNGDFVCSSNSGRDLDLGSGTVTLGGNIQISLSNWGRLIVGGTIQDNGHGYSLTKSGAGQGPLILSGANTYTGSTTISSGFLELRNANALQNSTVVSSPSFAIRGKTRVFSQLSI